MVSNAQRAKMMSVAQFLIDNHDHINYAETRSANDPMSLRGGSLAQLEHIFRSGGKIRMDCSEAIAVICRLSGLRDPNGSGYDGFGYTGTLLAHLPHYTNILDAHDGAILIFGGGTGLHAVMKMPSPDPADPWLFSHGRQGGPFHSRHSFEETGFVGEPQTWLDISHL
jgi:hypothetical protein